MTTEKNNNKPLVEDMHAGLERSLIEGYLKEKGYTLKELRALQEEEFKQFMKDASTYASGKLAELEERAHFLQELHDAYFGQ
jgi:DNA-binding transcriptional MerR regulator